MGMPRMRPPMQPPMGMPGMPPRPPMPPMGAVPGMGGDDGPPAKKAKTEESLIPEDQFLARNKVGEIKVKVRVVGSFELYVLHVVEICRNGRYLWRLSVSCIIEEPGGLALHPLYTLRRHCV